MCLDLEQRRFGASRVASPLPAAATGPSEAAMGNHTGESTQEVSIVRTCLCSNPTDAPSSGLLARTRPSANAWPALASMSESSQPRFTRLPNAVRSASTWPRNKPLPSRAFPQQPAPRRIPLGPLRAVHRFAGRRRKGDLNEQHRNRRHSHPRPETRPRAQPLQSGAP